MQDELVKFEQTNLSIPVIKVTHNNIQFNLVVDTGCSVSSIDAEILDLLLHKTTAESTDGVIYGNNSEDESVPIIEMLFKIGNQQFYEKFNAVNFRDTFQQVKDTFGVTIRGLLGSDFFYKYGLVLDFKNKVIYYGNKNQTKLPFGESALPETTD